VVKVNLNLGAPQPPTDVYLCHESQPSI